MNMSAERMSQPPSSPKSNREKAFPVISSEEKPAPLEISSEDLTPLLHGDEEDALAEEWFAGREKEAENNQKVLETEEPLENVEPAQEETPRDLEAFICETINKAEAEAARAEKAAATKIGKALHGLHKVFEATGGTLVALYEHLKEGAEDFAHDTSDTVLGTTATDTMKGFWKNIFGKQNAEIRTRSHEQHRGIREMATMEVTTLKEVWGALAEIPEDIARRLDAEIEGVDGLITKMAQDVVRGVRQERRMLREHDMQSMWGPLERSMGSTERLGEMLGGIGARMHEAREEHQDAIVDETRNAQRTEGGIYQDAITQRIETLTKKTKISQEDRDEIASLAATLARARQEEIGADEMATLVARAEAFAKKVEAHKDDEHLLLGYIAGRAINTIRSLTIMQGEEGESIIRALQEDPNVKNLHRAEELVHTHVEQELRTASKNLLTIEHRAKLQRARETLQDSVFRATELYMSSLTHTTADLTRGLQAVSREMKRTLAQAEVAHQEQVAAK